MADDSDQDQCLSDAEEAQSGSEADMTFKGEPDEEGSTDQSGAKTPGEKGGTMPRSAKGGKTRGQPRGPDGKFLAKDGEATAPEDHDERVNMLSSRMDAMQNSLDMLIQMVQQQGSSTAGDKAEKTNAQANRPADSQVEELNVTTSKDDERADVLAAKSELNSKDDERADILAAKSEHNAQGQKMAESQPKGASLDPMQSASTQEGVRPVPTQPTREPVGLYDTKSYLTPSTASSTVQDLTSHFKGMTCYNTRHVITFVTNLHNKMSEVLERHTGDPTVSSHWMALIRICDKHDLTFAELCKRYPEYRTCGDVHRRLQTIMADAALATNLRGNLKSLWNAATARSLNKTQPDEDDDLRDACLPTMPSTTRWENFRTALYPPRPARLRIRAGEVFPLAIPMPSAIDLTEANAKGNLGPFFTARCRYFDSYDSHFELIKQNAILELLRYFPDVNDDVQRRITEHELTTDQAVTTPQILEWITQASSHVKFSPKPLRPDRQQNDFGPAPQEPTPEVSADETITHRSPRPKGHHAKGGAKPFNDRKNFNGRRPPKDTQVAAGTPTPPASEVTPDSQSSGKSDTRKPKKSQDKVHNVDICHAEGVAGTIMIRRGWLGFGSPNIWNKVTATLTK